jgi:sec-independent protein translocase protein TatA
MLAVINDTGMVVVLAAVVLLFGASRLPNLARSLGEARKEFKKAHDEPDGDTSRPAPTAALPLAAGPADPSAQVVTLTRAELDALVASRDAARQVPTASS